MIITQMDDPSIPSPNNPMILNRRGGKKREAQLLKNSLEKAGVSCTVYENEKKTDIEDLEMKILFGLSNDNNPNNTPNYDNNHTCSVCGGEMLFPTGTHAYCSTQQQLDNNPKQACTICGDDTIPYITGICEYCSITKSK